MSITITQQGLPIIRKIVDEAERFIHLVDFVLSDKDVCDLLVKKCVQSDIPIEVVTTPPDSEKTEEGQRKAEILHRELADAGVILNECIWEVGNPRRTQTSLSGPKVGGVGQKWYAIHSKFMVTDKCALMTSANFYGFGDIDVYCEYRGSSRIQMMEKAYQRFKEFFSNVERFIPSEYIETSVDAFGKTRKNILGYPLQSKISFNEGFWICPTDTWARPLFEKAVKDAKKFVYCVFERFFDDEMTNLLAKKITDCPNMDLKMLCGSGLPMDKPQKAKSNFLSLVYHGAKLRMLDNLHAKFLVTDDCVLLGSANLAKMNLGFVREGMWVSNTETIDINQQPEFVQMMKRECERLFAQGYEKQLQWFKDLSRNSLRLAGATRISRKAAETLGELILEEEKQVTQKIRKISRMAIVVAKLQGEDRVTERHVETAKKILRLAEKGVVSSDEIRQAVGLVSVPDTLLKELKSLLQK